MTMTALQSLRTSLEKGIKAGDLTARQREVLCYILQCWLSGFLPSFREIGSELDIGSPNGVACHLRALKQKGYVQECEAGSSLMLADKALEIVL